MPDRNNFMNPLYLQFHYLALSSAAMELSVLFVSTITLVPYLIKSRLGFFQVLPHPVTYQVNDSKNAN